MAKALSDKDIATMVGKMVDDARSFIGESLADDRETAQEFYQGLKTGALKGEEGRSSVVSTDVRDSINGVMPSLQKIFCGDEQAVEFMGVEQGDDAQALQETDVINHVFLQDNPGLMICNSAFEDGLVKKLGFVKWWYDRSKWDESVEYTGLTVEELLRFEAQEDLDVEVTGKSDEELPVMEATVTKHHQNGGMKVAAVPAEEILFDRHARDANNEYTLWAHQREMRVDEIHAMGFDIPLKDILEQANHDNTEQETQEGYARRFDQGLGVEHVDEQDKMTQPVRITDAYVRLSLKQDGATQLFRVTLLGRASKFLKKTPISHVPIAYFSPYPIAHALVGRSMADETMDIQDIKTKYERGMNESMSLAIEPQMEVDINHVNVGDLLDPDLNSFIRVTKMGAIREMAHRPVIGPILEALNYYDEKIRKRTGRRTDEPGGLNADKLQSMTEIAASAVESASQERLEMIARYFAEGFRVMFTGIRKTMIENQDRARTIRLRNEYVSIDPSTWTANRDVRINVGLGQGSSREKMQVMGLVVQKSEDIIGRYGPTNPISGVQEWLRAVERFLQLGGEPRVDKYFNSISDEEMQELAQASSEASQPPPDPAAMAMAEVAKVQAETDKQAAEVNAEIKLGELALKKEEMLLKDDRIRDEQAATAILKKIELELKYSAKLDEAAIKQETDAYRAELDAEAKREGSVIQAISAQGVAEIQKESGGDEGREE